MSNANRLHGTKDTCITQRAKILGLLLRARGGWIPLPEILRLGIAQFGARIYELRRLGFHIENRIEVKEGIRHSWYRLLPAQQSLFADAIEAAAVASREGQP